MFPIPTPQPLYGYGSYQHSSYHSASKTLGPYQSDAYPTSGYPPPSPVPYDSGELEFGTNTILPWWTFPRSSEFPGASRQELPNPDLDPEGQADLWAWTWDRTAKSLVLSPIVIFTILGNFLVLYAFFSRKKVSLLSNFCAIFFFEKFRNLFLHPAFRTSAHPPTSSSRTYHWPIFSSES